MMTDYSEICEVKILDSAKEVNQLLKTFWLLLDVFHSDGNCFFVLGKLYASGTDCTDCEIFDYGHEEV